MQLLQFWFQVSAVITGGALLPGLPELMIEHYRIDYIAFFQPAEAALILSFMYVWVARKYKVED